MQTLLIDLRYLSYLEPYNYKDTVEIPALGWIDGLITVLESGYKTSRMNAFINAKLAMKKLRLGANKCFNMHIGKDHEEYKNVQLLIDGWSVKTVDNYDTRNTEFDGILESDMNKIYHIHEEKYLGQVISISSDSKNTYNIEKLDIF